MMLKFNDSAGNSFRIEGRGTKAGGGRSDNGNRYKFSQN